MQFQRLGKGSGLGNWNLQGMEQKLDHRLPQGELSLALLNYCGGLGKEMVLARVRDCPPPDSPPLLELWNQGILQSGVILQHSWMLISHNPWLPPHHTNIPLN